MQPLFICFLNPACENFHLFIGSDIQCCSRCRYKNCLTLSYCYAVTTIVGYCAASGGAYYNNERIKFCKVDAVFFADVVE